MAPIARLFERYPQLQVCEEQIQSSLKILSNSFRNKGKLLIMGNGGSSADAEHFCGELMKGFLSKRRLSAEQTEKLSYYDRKMAENLQDGLPALSLGVAHSLISAFSNDCDPTYVFAQQIHVLAQPQDVVFAISTSGNSKNVVAGVQVAKVKGVKTLALTGERQSALSELADVTIQVPGQWVHEIQELHLPVYHALCMALEKEFFGE